jgi:hypothetical protein
MSTSPKALARSAGLFYWLNFAFLPGMIATTRYVRVSDAAATSTNILAHTTLFNAGFTGNLIAVTSYLVVTALFYQIFKVVDRNISLIAALMSATGCVMLAVATVFYSAPLATLTGVQSASGPALQQAQLLALTFIMLYGQIYNTSLVFFALYCALIGYLTLKSTFLPRILGVLLMLAGAGWLTFLWPPLARAVFPYQLLAGVGELTLATWLIVKGVNVDRWNEQARTE